MTDPAQELEAIALYCDQTAASSRMFSHRHYYVNYSLMIASLAGSIGAAVLAFWDGIDAKLIGLVALLPAICASVVSQLRLVEKGNWHFRRKHAMNRLARDLRLASLRNPDWKSVEAANANLAELEGRLEGDWDTTLAFRFQLGETVARTPSGAGTSGQA